MKLSDLSNLLTELSPAELRQRIAELDRERSALVVLLRATTNRQLGRRNPKSSRPKEAARG